MSVGPPHLYITEGKKKRVSEEILQNALTQAQIVQKRGLPPILTLRHLAFLTGVQYKFLRELVAHRRLKSYRSFQISKRSGGKRNICVPEPALKRVQQWIHESILIKTKPHWRSFAFMPNTSIVDCAQQHCGCKWLVKLDIQRFFESISEKEVYKVFLKLGYQPLVSFELARICTRKNISSTKVKSGSKWAANPYQYTSIPYYQSMQIGHLPQGAPTSPMLANLVCKQMDDKLYHIANQAGLVYSRYADDLVFSSSDPSFNRGQAIKIVRIVSSVLKRYGFEPHQNKTAIIPPGARKVVLGLLVDTERPRLSKDFRHKLERHIWAINKFGLSNHARHSNFDSIWGFKRHVEGLIAFARMVDSDFGNSMKKTFNDALIHNGL